MRRVFAAAVGAVYLAFSFVAGSAHVHGSGELHEEAPGWHLDHAHLVRHHHGPDGTHAAAHDHPHPRIGPRTVPSGPARGESSGSRRAGAPDDSHDPARLEAHAVTDDPAGIDAPHVDHRDCDVVYLSAWATQSLSRARVLPATVSAAPTIDRPLARSELDLADSRAPAAPSRVALPGTRAPPA